MTQTITPYLLYEDAGAALDFLSQAFGFREELRMISPAGHVNHAEMRLGDGQIMLGQPGSDFRNPDHLGGATVGIYVRVDDVDGTYERAKAAGVAILEEPADQDYGERRFGATDPEGHQWWFAQPIPEQASDAERAVPATG
jgi:uncharacterized glyoxalase superfamily protein PhnB